VAATCAAQAARYQMVIMFVLAGERCSYRSRLSASPLHALPMPDQVTSSCMLPRQAVRTPTVSPSSC
jgi:hypothetical protein